MVKFLLLILIFINNSYATSCKESLALSKVAALLHIELPLVDETRISKITKSFIEILDEEKIYLTKPEYFNIIEESQKKSFTIYKEINNNNCLFYDGILAKIKKGKERYTSYFIKKLKEKANKEYIFYARKYPFQSFNSEKDIFEHIDKNSKNIIESREIILNELVSSFEKEDNRNTEDIFLQSIVRSFDPHSNFFNTKDSESLMNSLQGLVYGIGINIVPANKKFGTGLLIHSVSEDSPAEGIFLDKDIILKINDKDIEKETFSDAKKYFKNVEKFNFVVKRNNKIITLKTINKKKYANLDERVSSKVIKKNKKNISIIKVPSFYMDKKSKKAVSYDFLLEYKKLYESKKIDLLIIDLRDNSGGSLEEAVRLSGLFIPKEKIVTVKGSQFVEDFKSPYTETYIDKPTLVLVNRNSASASEIFAAALKDYGKALIVGDDHTFGKGSAQTIYPDIKENTLFKITSQLFFSPAGSSIQHTGVSSDIIIPSKYQLVDIGEKNILFSLTPSFLERNTSIKKILDLKKVSSLQTKSEIRVKNNKDFNKFSNLEEYFKWSAEQTTDDIVDKNEKDIILNESVAIGLDYLNIKRKK